MKKHQLCSLIAITLLYSQPFYAEETPTPAQEQRVYDDVHVKWASPTPWVKDRWTDFIDNMPHGAIAVEIGVQGGGFSAFMLKTNPEKLYLIDCWEYQDPDVYDDPESNPPNEEQEELYQHTKKRFANDFRVEILRKYSKDAVELFEDEFFDWVYIDANHSYEAAKEDLALWWPKVKKGGYLSGHDYIIRPSFGVVLAVNEFLIEHNLYFSVLTTMEGGGFDSWAVQKPL